MATSLPTVTLPSGIWVDIYAATGIATGTPVIIQNLGTTSVRLVESVAKPELTGGYNLIDENTFLTSADVPVGIWAYSYSGVKIQVAEA